MDTIDFNHTTEEFDCNGPPIGVFALPLGFEHVQLINRPIQLTWATIVWPSRWPQTFIRTWVTWVPSEPLLSVSLGV
jgi:hypothetical protein